MTAVKKIGTGVLGLDAEEREWMSAKWRLIRRSQFLADTATNDWNRINDELNSYLDRSGISDIVQRVRIKTESIPLLDAFETGKWHAANSQRHIDDVALFLRLKELGLL